MALPQWYAELLELQALIDAGDWSGVHQTSKNLLKQLYANAPSVKTPFETVVLITMNADITEEQKKQLIEAYNLSLKAAKKELATSDYDRIINEEEIADQLSVINSHISSSWRIVWNYWWGGKAGDFVKWEKIGKELQEIPITRMGRLRLMARHVNIGKRITPAFATMMVQLWPLVLLWVIKKTGPLLINSIFQNQLEKRKTKKQMLALQSKMKGKGFDIGSLKKATTPQRSKRRSKKKSRRKRA
jgi:hypothetical protein